MEVRKSAFVRTREETVPKISAENVLAIWNHSSTVGSIVFNPLLKCGYCLDGKKDKQTNLQPTRETCGLAFQFVPRKK